MTVISQKRDFVFDFDSHVITQRGEYIYLHIDGRDVEMENTSRMNAHKKYSKR